MTRRTTSIEWTQHTWNPFVGCSIRSAGCTNCYAMRLAGRLEAFGQAAYRGTTRDGVWTGRLNRSSDATMAKPLGEKQPSVFFVNSMSDFWHPSAEDRWRAEALAIMRATPHHTYQVLTKRPEEIGPTLSRMGITRLPDNLWLGATVEDGRVAGRIDYLRHAPARIKFLSVEPLIRTLGRPDLRGIDWMIVGGESGPSCRPMQADWVRETRDHAVGGEVAYFFKQWGHWRNNPIRLQAPPGVSGADYVKAVDPHGKGGGLVDGRLWREFPDHAKVAA